MFGIDDKNIKKLEKDLEFFAARAVPFATKFALNKAAFTAQRIARADVKRNLINRNRFTVQSIQVDQARTLNINRQSSTVGSIAGYMEDQEFGTIKSSGGKEGVSIATSYSAGQAGAGRRTKLPTDVNNLQAIQLRKGRKKGQSKRQRSMAAIKGAAGSGRRYVFLELARSKGIFKVVGGKKYNRIRMVHDMTRRSVVVPKRPWLEPAHRQAQDIIPLFYTDGLEFQLRRRGLFDGR